MSKPSGRWLAAICGGLALSLAQGEDDAAGAPDLEFLEYLGTWQASDEEWLAVSGWSGDARPGERERDDANTDEANDETD